MKCKYKESCGYDFCEEEECSEYEAIPMTNAAHIRSMSDEELAAHFAAMAEDTRSGTVYSDDEGRWLEWLKQPYKENEE